MGTGTSRRASAGQDGTRHRHWHKPFNVRMRKDRKKKERVVVSTPDLSDINNRGTFNDYQQEPPPQNGWLITREKRLVVRAMYDYVKRYSDDINFKKGDKMEILSKGSGDDWWRARHVTNTNLEGYIPSNYVVLDDNSIESQEWWFSLDRSDACKQLMLPGNPIGTFLVRNSSDNSSYALSILDRDSPGRQLVIRHFLIRKMEDGHSVFITARKTFSSLIQLIEFYSKPENRGTGGLPCQLTMPCPREALPVPFKDLEVNESEIQLAERLGSGQFGEVFAGIFRGVVSVAVKSVKLNAMTDEAFLAEAETMHQLRHHKLVQLLGVCRRPLYIITERMSNGSLLDYLRQDSAGAFITFAILIDMAAQVADGMSYLEWKHFIHRDLRAANVLVGDRNIVKVADFGLARLLDTSNNINDVEDESVYIVRPETKFPIKWTAPEAFLSQQFTIKSDVWSFGILLSEMITFGRIPYPDLDNNAVRDRIIEGYRMPNPNGTRGASGFMCCCPDYLYDLMRNCWHAVPENRPTFESLKHILEDFPVSSEVPYAEP